MAESTQHSGSELPVILTEASSGQIAAFRSRHHSEVLTILFCDQVGSTEAQRKGGNVHAFEITSEHRRLFRELLATFKDGEGLAEGEEVETAGDSFLVVFARPSKAVLFALQLHALIRQERTRNPGLLPVRVGLDQGEIITQRHTSGPKPMDIYGLQVSLAARTTDLGGAHQTLCSRRVADDARAVLTASDLTGLSKVEWENHGPYQFKGDDTATYDVCQVGEIEFAGTRNAEGAMSLPAPPASAKGWPAGQSDEEPGWRPAAGVKVPETNWVLVERLGKERDPKTAVERFRGAFGEVWKAFNPSSKTTRAFKFCFKRAQVPALKREARLLEKLRTHRHPHIVEVYDVTEGDRPPHFLEMEYVEGPSLEEWLAENPPLDERLEAVAQIADALQVVHASGIYHRDIKPSNILLARDSEGRITAKLSDFGLGATEDPELLKSIYASRVEGVAGTWDYLAPELRNGGPATARSDIYSMGLTLYQIIKGDLRLPKPGNLARALDDPILREDIERCWADDPADRWPQAANLAKALRTHDARVAEREAEIEKQHQRQRIRRLKAIAGVAGIITAISLTFGGMAAWQWKEANKQKEIAEEQRTTAVKNEQEVEKQRGIAETRSREASTRLAELDAYQGRVWYSDRSDPTRALFYFAKAAEDSAQAGLDGAPYALWVQQLAQRMPESVLAHDDQVRSAAFSPDGLLVVTASADRTARIWDAATDRPVGEPMKHEHEVYSAAFSPDGLSIVTASADRTARIWDAATGTPVGEPMKHEGAVYSATFSPDGLWVVTASRDGTARVWDAATGLSVGEPMEHDEAVWSASFSPGGLSIVTASGDGIARVWDAASGRPLGELMIHDSRVNSVAFSPDGHWIVTASADGTARIWDAATGRPVGEPMKHEDEVYSAAFSPDGLWIVTASGAAARVWDAATGLPVSEPMQLDFSIESATFSPDGLWILTASRDDTARVWDAATGLSVGEPMNHEGAVYSASFSPPDGKWVVTASDNYFDGTSETRVWDAATGRPVGTPMKLDDDVTSASFSPDALWVVTASRDGTARVWDAATGLPVGEPMKHEGWVNSASFSPDGLWIVTASADRTARLWDAATGLPVGEPMKCDETVWSASFSPDGRWVLTSSSGGTWIIWPVGATVHEIPDWLPRMPEALTGMRLVDAEKLETIPLDEYLELREAWFTEVRAAAKAGDEAAQFVIRRWNPELAGVWS
ncbi:MAG: protein kinase [Candidatus Hydrogenedentes bacterium]|nr:protein kinase [Candidatus Hydrogenedentota bacterium]